ncbi:MAG: hypothetical protein GY913_22730 [Proteobacteria bacterium]|nr:hypothetical protein [Pseudomonadota bacterium]MCP4919726.1 hypothetical protein [Pseudomonadota bacterium]
MWFLLLACNDANLAEKQIQVATAVTVSPATYAERLAAIDQTRTELAARHAAGEQVVPEARATIEQALREDIWPAWYGTTWGFYGTSQAPGEGEIACGYFVSTTLRDVGLDVARVELAQQASARIVDTFAGEPVTTWGEDVDEVLDRLEPGIHVVGLDYHVAFLDKTESTTRMCHSSVLEPGAVVCETALTAEAMASNVHVTGPLLEDAVVVAWLERTELATGGS